MILRHASWQILSVVPNNHSILLYSNRTLILIEYLAAQSRDYISIEERCTNMT